MRDRGFVLEAVAFGCGAALLLVAAGAVTLLRAHHAVGNARIAYSLFHAPAGLVASGLFALAALGGYLFYARRPGLLSAKPTGFFVVGLVVLFVVFWLPVLLTANFVHDDWQLLAAAATRRIILTHPFESWWTLDSVDGNFRPLGTVVYLGYVFRMAGLHATPFLAGNFVINLASVLTGFLIVRELGYSRVAAATGAALFLSRGMLYTQSAWMSAMGDCLVTLLTALVALLLLRSLKARGGAAVGLHVGAWCLFVLSTLAKQSAFTTPLLVLIVLFLRPGDAAPVPLRRRTVQALLGSLVYAASAGVVFLHAKALLQFQTPYPMRLTLATALRTFSYAFWYFETLELPTRLTYAPYVPAFLGIVVVGAAVLVIRRFPGLLGERPRDLLFLLLAALGSVSIFLLLPTRNEAYYGTMAGFWLSLAVGIMLTRFGAVAENNRPARVAAFAACTLIVVGYADVRLKQAALLWPGGYVWGTYNMDFERGEFEQLRTALTAVPDGGTAVLVDPPPSPSYFTCMALLADRGLGRVLVYETDTGLFLANDHLGLRPGDGVSSLTDVGAYNWLTPVDAGTAGRLTSRGGTVWVRFHESSVALAGPAAGR